MGSTMVKYWYAEGYVTQWDDWVSTGNYYGWVNLKLDYYVKINRRYKRGYSATIYLSKENNTTIKVSSVTLDNIKQCKAWVEEEISVYENCPDRFEVLCNRKFNTDRATVYKKLKNGDLEPYFSTFHSHYMMGLNKIAPCYGEYVYEKYGNDNRWLVKFNSGCISGSNYKE